jgi:hypothetical protein
VIALTPLQSFVIGVVSALIAGLTLVLLVRRSAAKLREKHPDYFANFAHEVERKKELKAKRDDEELSLRRREVELLETMVENQEVIIRLLRHSLEEKAMS